MPDKSPRGGEKSQSDRQTATEIARELGLNISTVRAWIHQDRIPARKDGRAWTVKRSDVQQFLEENPTFGLRRRSRQAREVQAIEELPSHSKPRRPGSSLTGLDL